MSKECSCEKCIRACHRLPGKFAPGEAEKAAELLGVPFSEFQNKLIKNYHYDPDKDPKMWQPRKVGDDGDELASDEWTNTEGTCVFLKNDRCEIHAAKPYECRETLCCEVSPSPNEMWKEMNGMWKASGLLP